MKRITIIIIFIIFCVADSESQAIEVYSNLIYSIVDRHRIDNSPPNFTDYGFVTYNLGANYHFKKKNRLHYILGLSYDKKGKDTEYRLSGDYVVSRYNFLSVRGLVNFKLPKNEFQVGAYYGFLTNTSITPYDNSVKEKIENMRNYNVGVSGIAHQKLFTTNELQGFFRLEANYDLTTLWSAYYSFSFTNFERAVTLGLGFVLRWNYKEKE